MKIGVFLLSVVWAATSIGQVKVDTIALRMDTGDLEGTLLVPDTTEKIPVALIIAGSGPTDRDGNNPMMGNNSLKMLAEGLADGGVATLRYDKRGIGKSQAAGGKEEDLRFESYIDDAREWIAQLKEDPRFSEVIVVGHSEGSLIGMIAAEGGNVSTFISISGAGLAAGDLIRQQIEQQAPMLSGQADTIIDRLEEKEPVDSVPQMLYSLFRPSVQPYLISWFQYKPTVELAKLEIPILIVQGTTDVQVDVSQAEVLAKANPQAQLEIVDGMNHILKEASKDPQENMSTYSDPDMPLKAGFIDKLLKFIATR